LSDELRRSAIERLRSERFDVAIVGAGINGAVSAASLAARGLRVALIDRGDFGGGTSSQSSNLAWGGIKYLESGEVGLVWDLCGSRNQLMKSFPSTVREIRFLTTIERGFRRSSLLVYLGTLIYWAFGRFFTRPPELMSAAGLKRREPLIDTKDAVRGIEYSDCYLHDNDARFVWGFVKRAIGAGAAAANYVSSTSIRQRDDRWRIDARDEMTGEAFQIDATVLINACGPWVDDHNRMASESTKHRHVLSKGIHLIVDRMMERRRILAFFASDGRLFFVMPMGPKTCIGTTDTRTEDPLEAVSEEDRQFVLSNANELLDLKTPLTTDDIIAERCGVRPLAVTGSDAGADWIALSRKHAIEANPSTRHVSIFGGKLTDCINVGDEIAGVLKDFGLPVDIDIDDWFGEPDASVRARFFREAEAMQLDAMADPRSAERLSKRFWRRYGEAAFDMLEAIRNDRSLADRVIDEAEYLRCEIEYTAKYEMITRLDDFLRRRSKISLVVPAESFHHDPGLREVCQVFFGESADERLAEYLDGQS